MRDSVLFYINGQRYAVSGAAAFCTLTDFLRDNLQKTGTKVVCAEGDCGACTVLVGRPDGDRLRYVTADACILFLLQLDGCHVVTVEGLPANGELHPVQRALIDHHGSQCGFCTPGFVMSLAGLAETGGMLSPERVRLGLSGNLCRCTGYLQILEAAASLPSVPPLNGRFADSQTLTDLRAHAREPTLVRSSQLGPGEHVFFSPRTLEEALAFKAQNPGAAILAGATELGVAANKKGLYPATLLSLQSVAGLGDIARTGDTLVIGANVRWSQLEAYVRELWPEFYRLIVRFGSPQIRNVATLAGNVANGSPIADSLPLLFIVEAEVEVQSCRGSRRVPINSFYKAYKVTDLAADELITHIHIPLPRSDEVVKLYKVSRRNDLDIATFGAGIRVQSVGNRIGRAWLAYGGVAPTVVRLLRTEAFLRGKPFAEATFAEAGRLARTEIQPISDVRGSRDFRLRLAENILMKFFLESAPLQHQAS